MKKKTPKTISRLRASGSFRKPLKSLIHWKRTRPLKPGGLNGQVPMHSSRRVSVHS